MTTFSVLDDAKGPGRMPVESTTYYNDSIFRGTFMFISRSQRPLGRCADIGSENSKCEFIKELYQIKVTQLDLPDFNFDEFNPGLKGKFDTVFCFEVIEHLQNPLFFMSQVSGLLAEGGVIYLSTPGRPKIIWNKHHFFEIPPPHLERWILAPLSLKIIRKRKIRIERPWYGYIGVRPIIRLFCNYTWIYEIEKNIKTGFF